MENLKKLEREENWGQLLEITTVMLAQELEPKDQLDYFQGVAQHELGNYQKAIDSFNRGLLVSNNQAQLLNAKGLTLIELKNTNDAKLCFESSIKCDNNFHLSKINLAKVLADEGHVEDSLKLLDQVLENKIKQVPILIFKAETLKNTNRFEEALACYEKALSLEPEAEDLLNNKGSLLAMIGRKGEAKINFEKAIEVKSNFEIANFNLALLELDRGEGKNALDLLQKIHSKSVSDESIVLATSSALISLNKIDQAKNKLKSSEKLLNTSDCVKYNLGIVFGIMGKHKKIITTFNKFSNETHLNLISSIENSFVNYNNLINSKSYSKDLSSNNKAIFSDLMLRWEDELLLASNLKIIQQRLILLIKETIKCTKIIDSIRSLQNHSQLLYLYISAISSFAQIYANKSNLPESHTSFINSPPPTIIMHFTDIDSLIFGTSQQCAAGIYNQEEVHPNLFITKFWANISNRVLSINKKTFQQCFLKVFIKYLSNDINIKDELNNSNITQFSQIYHFNKSINDFKPVLRFQLD